MIGSYVWEPHTRTHQGGTLVRYDVPGLPPVLQVYGGEATLHRSAMRGGRARKHARRRDSRPARVIVLPPIALWARMLAATPDGGLRMIVYATPDEWDRDGDAINRAARDAALAWLRRSREDATRRHDPPPDPFDAMSADTDRAEDARILYNDRR